MINRYVDDPEMLRLRTQIESNSFAVDPGTFTGSPDAEAVSRTLYYFDTVKFLVDRQLISLEDIASLRDPIVAFFENAEVQRGLKYMSEVRSRWVINQNKARQLYEQLRSIS